MDALDSLLTVFEGACGVCDCPPAWALTPENVALWDMDQWDLEWAIRYGQIEQMFPWATGEATKPARWRGWDGKIGLSPEGFAGLPPRERCREIFRALGEAAWEMLPYRVQLEFYKPEARQAIGVEKPDDLVQDKFAEKWADFVVDPSRLKRENPQAYRAMVYATENLCRFSGPEEGKPAASVAWRQQCSIDPGRLLYHVTTDVAGVREKGLLTRDELGLEKGTGLGGGRSDTVSFTTDKSVAEDIEFALREAIRYLRGEITPDDLLAMAKRGENARRPFYEDLLDLVVGRRSLEGEEREKLLAEHIDRLRRGVKETYRLTGRPVEELPPGSRPIRYWVGGDGRTYVSVWEEPASEEEIAEEKWRLYNAFLYARQEAGGPENPVFFLTDIARLAQKRPDDIRALTFTLRPGVELTDENAEGFGYGGRWLGLSELRLKSGKMVMPYHEWRKQYGGQPQAPGPAAEGR